GTHRRVLHALLLPHQHPAPCPTTPYASSLPSFPLEFNPPADPPHSDPSLTAWPPCRCSPSSHRASPPPHSRSSSSPPSPSPSPLNRVAAAPPVSVLGARRAPPPARPRCTCTPTPCPSAVVVVGVCPALPGARTRLRKGEARKEPRASVPALPRSRNH
ncbi:hypothetical protein DFH09DRAFT_1399466, partial [Mycena vulgaris]